MSTLITLALVVVMIGGLIGIFVCNKKMGTLPGAQGIAIGLLVLVIASGAGFLYRTGIIGPSEGEMIRTIEHRIYASQAYGLAKWMKENNYSNEKVLVIAEENWETDPKTQLFKEVLIAEGIPAENITFDSILPPELDANGKVKVFPFPTQLRVTDPKKYNAKFQEYSDHKIIAMLVGLPMGTSNQIDPLKNRESDAAQKMVLLGTAPPDRAAFRKALEKGNVGAYCKVRPDAIYEPESLPESQEEIMALRYIFISKTQNMDQL